jgi:hypothetical protein
LGLLVTAHADVGLPTLLETSTSLELAQAIVACLPNATAGLPTGAVAACFQRAAGDMRETLFALYDTYERRGT